MTTMPFMIKSTLQFELWKEYQLKMLFLQFTYKSFPFIQWISQLPPIIVNWFAHNSYSIVCIEIHQLSFKLCVYFLFKRIRSTLTYFIATQVVVYPIRLLMLENKKFVIYWFLSVLFFAFLYTATANKSFEEN